VPEPTPSGPAEHQPGTPATATDAPVNRVHALLRTDQPAIMGILNATPDSFSDGGRYQDLNLAVAHGRQLAAEGADIIDVGGESTRPGAEKPSVAEELDRVLPLIETLAAQIDTPLSIDTSRPEVMTAAVAAGAAMINDIRALTQEGALTAAAALHVPVCLMHMQGTPATMQENPRYDDVVADVRHYLAGRLIACLEAGISSDDLIIDPGFGFGKTLHHNLTLLRRLNEFGSLGKPLLVGISRKGMLGQLTGRDVDNRLAGSLAAAVIAMQRGASIIRVHDVAATRDALTIARAATNTEPMPDSHPVRWQAVVQLRNQRQVAQRR
jgi:dihydropteroate synthase